MPPSGELVHMPVSPMGSIVHMPGQVFIPIGVLAQHSATVREQRKMKKEPGRERVPPLTFFHKHSLLYALPHECVITSRESCV